MWARHVLCLRRQGRQKDNLTKSSPTTTRERRVKMGCVVRADLLVVTFLTVEDHGRQRTDKTGRFTFHHLPLPRSGADYLQRLFPLMHMHMHVKPKSIFCECGVILVSLDQNQMFVSIQAELRIIAHMYINILTVYIWVCLLVAASATPRKMTAVANNLSRELVAGYISDCRIVLLHVFPAIAGWRYI